MKLNKNLLFILSASLLIMTQTAHADFRKALEAYQARDGATMLKEVKDAVDKKSDDGLILFLSVLELDAVLAKSSMFVFYEEREILAQISETSPSPWQTILNNKQVDEFSLLIDKATQQSSLESQYRLISLRRPLQDYLMLTGRKKTQSGLLAELKKLGEQGYANVYPYLMDISETEAEKNDAYQKGIALGHTKLQMLNAVDYLFGNQTRQIPKDEKKGLQLLAQSLSKPDAAFYYADIANKLSEYYLKKGTHNAQKQAYLWALVALVNSRSGLVPKSLIELKKSSALKKVAPNIDASWDESFNKTTQRMRELGVDITQFYASNGLPKELKEMRSFEQPELIVKNQKIDLQSQPMLSFHHFYYDKHYIFSTSPVRNYLIDIYTDGRVNFSLGTRLDKSQNIETLIKITPEEVQNLVAKVRDFGIETEPLQTNTKNAAGCGMGSCDEIYDKIGAQPSFYYMALRDKKSVKTVRLNNREGDDLTTFFANTFKLLESRLHTQQYRCGTLKNRIYHGYCIEQDNRFFKSLIQPA